MISIVCIYAADGANTLLESGNTDVERAQYLPEVLAPLAALAPRRGVTKLSYGGDALQ